jgi:pentatricopeptide repeat protein
MLNMHQQNVKVPAKAVTALVRVAAATSIHGSNEADAAATAAAASIPEVVDTLRQVPVPAEAISIALADCLSRDDLRTSLKLEVRLRAHRQLSYGVMEPLLKLSAKLNEDRALQLFQEMQDNGYFLSEGLCGLLLSRCGESRHLRLAETVSSYLKSKGMMTLAIYKTLMKVFATCQLFDKACRLYYDLKADGIEPDKVMYGCLVKFAVKCGQSELVAELSEKVQGDTQNYSWLIRSAGQAGNVSHALELLQKLKSMNDDVLLIPWSTTLCLMLACPTGPRRKLTSCCRRCVNIT